MPALSVGFRQVSLGASTSNLTGTPWLVQDYARLSVSVQTSIASASVTTLIGSNDDGFQSPLGTPSQSVNSNGWSIITALSGANLWEFDPGSLGFRWINAFRPAFGVSASSNITVTFAGSW